MLKNESNYVPWIFGGFIIVMMLFILWSATQDTLQQIDVTISGGGESYKRQAAAMHVLESEGRKSVLNNLDSITSVKQNEKCTVREIPGFPKPYLLKFSESRGCSLFAAGNDPNYHFYLKEVPKSEMRVPKNPEKRIMFIEVLPADQ